MRRPPSGSGPRPSRATNDPDVHVGPASTPRIGVPPGLIDFGEEAEGGRRRRRHHDGRITLSASCRDLTPPLLPTPRRRGQIGRIGTGQISGRRQDPPCPGSPVEGRPNPRRVPDIGRDGLPFTWAGSAGTPPAGRDGPRGSLRRRSRSDGQGAAVPAWGTLTIPGGPGVRANSRGILLPMGSVLGSIS